MAEAVWPAGPQAQSTQAHPLTEARPRVDASVGISIRRLYKIFGPTPGKFLEPVQQGMSKQELRDVHGHVLGLSNISIDMPAGGIQVVMGLSGSGKSTLIRHINRLIDPTAGEVLIPVDGRELDVAKMSPRELLRFRREQTAMVFQKFALFPHLTVLENTEYGLQVQGVPGRKRREAAARWIERVGLKGYEDSYPNQLSGGMQQRRTHPADGRSLLRAGSADSRRHAVGAAGHSAGNRQDHRVHHARPGRGAAAGRPHRHPARR